MLPRSTRFRLFPLAALALGLIWAPLGASALTVEVGFAGSTQEFGAEDLGCGEPGDKGELACAGEGLTGAAGGWTLNNWNLFLDPDPTVSNSFSVTNNTALTQSFIMTVILPITPAFGPPSAIKGSIGGSATDNNGNGVTLSSTGTNPIYTALIDGVSVQTLHDAPFSVSTTNAFDTVLIPLANFGIPTALVIPVATNSTIALTIQFDLSPGDSAAITSVFNVEPVPEPGIAILLLLGGVAAAAGMRRAR